VRDQRGHECGSSVSDRAGAGRHEELIEQQLVADGLEGDAIAWAFESHASVFRQRRDGEVAGEVDGGIVAEDGQGLVARGHLRIGGGGQAEPEATDGGLIQFALDGQRMRCVEGWGVVLALDCDIHGGVSQQLVEIRGFPPLRQKEGARTGHGALVALSRRHYGT